MTTTTLEKPEVISQASKPKNRALMPAFIGSLITMTAILTAVFLIPTSHDKESFFAICVDKHRLLEATPQPRVILTGGSNVTLGIDSKQLESQIGKNVVSLSSNTLMGLSYELFEALDSAKAGDTIIVVPEYENWIGELNGSEAQMMMPSLLPRSIVWLLPSYFSSKPAFEKFQKSFFSSSKERLQRLFMIKKSAATSGFHIGKDFNERGDYIAHLDLAPKKFDLTESHAPDLRNVDPDAIKKFKTFAKLANAKGVKVVLMPPVITKSYLSAKDKQLAGLWRALSSKLGKNVQVLTDYSTFALDDNSFWDCKYHPRRAGREIRTAAVAADLNRAFASTGSSDGNSNAVDAIEKQTKAGAK